jgi:hypothetical protein
VNHILDPSILMNTALCVFRSLVFFLGGSVLHRLTITETRYIFGMDIHTYRNHFVGLLPSEKRPG